MKFFFVLGIEENVLSWYKVGTRLVKSVLHWTYEPNACFLEIRDKLEQELKFIGHIFCDLRYTLGIAQV